MKDKWLHLPVVGMGNKAGPELVNNYMQTNLQCVVKMVTVTSYHIIYHISAIHALCKNQVNL